MKIGFCKLCDMQAGLVQSHIVPKAFYEEYKGKTLKVISVRSDKVTTIRSGLYGNFLCQQCEDKFKKIDNLAVDIFKKGRFSEYLVANDFNQGVQIIKNALSHKSELHKFALSILWRAANSSRSEYNGLDLGLYNIKIKNAFNTSFFEESLLNSTGILFREFRGSEVDNADVVGHPYYLMNRKTHPNLPKVFGSFMVHSFGFPYGEMLIRLGGEKPKAGYYELVTGTSRKVVLWTSNLSDLYPDLVVFKTPRVTKYGKIFGSKMQKEILGLLKNKGEKYD